jgi:hypothetical protein
MVTRTTLLSLASLALLAACSGAGEDVRISFCKAIVTDLETSQRQLEWQNVETKHGRFSDLEVKLSYLASSPEPRTASCTYQKEHIPEDNVMHQADPLSTYRTRPSTVKLGDNAYAGASLSSAINATMKRRAKEFGGKIAEETQQAVTAAKEGAEKALNAASEGAEKALDGAREGTQKALMGLHDALEKEQPEESGEAAKAMVE